MKSLFVCLCMALCCGCASQAAIGDAKARVDLSNGLPLPMVPDSLRTPADRAAYVLDHFWDDMDFKNRKYALDDIFMESAFSNYGQLLGLEVVDSALARRSIDKLIAGASVDKDALCKVADIASLYLYGSDSPVYNEGVYLIFVESLLANPSIDETRRIRLFYDRDMLRLNASGTAPSDFNFIDRQGSEQTLRSAIAGKNAILILYDPDCDDCRKAIGIIASEPVTKQLIDNGKLTVVAVTESLNADLWKSSAALIPEQWIDGLDQDGIQDYGLYEIRFTPTIFFIGADGKVILKNARVGQILAALYQLAERE